jgi:parvulin-like peptidyl-prolyl isomerase
VSGAIGSSRGFVFATVTSKQDAYVPTLDEVKDKVRDKVLEQKARDFGRQKATDLSARVKTAGDFDKAVKAAGLTSETTELLTRESPIPGLGMAPEVTDAAFRLSPGTVSDPITTQTGSAVVKVLEKQEVSATELTSNKDRFREELLNDRRSRFFGAYMAKAKQKMRIEVNREVLQRVIG